MQTLEIEISEILPNLAPKSIFLSLKTMTVSSIFIFFAKKPTHIYNLSRETHPIFSAHPFHIYHYIDSYPLFVKIQDGN